VPASDIIDAMPLTPEDVQQKRFSTVRFKEGYDEVEVDAFLDEVTAELRRLNELVAELEARHASK
jgi:DivIVA domain-containing protein